MSSIVVGGSPFFWGRREGRKKGREKGIIILHEYFHADNN